MGENHQFSNSLKILVACPKVKQKIKSQWQKDGKWAVLPPSLRKGKRANENADKEDEWKRTKTI